MLGAWLAKRLITVYRWADVSAEVDSTAIKNLLLKAGLNPVLVDGSDPDVEAGTWEIRVPEAEVTYARELLKEIDEEDSSALDPSSELDMVPLVTPEGIGSEMDALSIQSILDANGINAMVVGASQLPNLGFEVRVAEADLDRARQVIAEAQAAGPAGAAEAERETEPPDQKGS